MKEYIFSVKYFRQYFFSLKIYTFLAQSWLDFNWLPTSCHWQLALRCSSPCSYSGAFFYFCDNKCIMHPATFFQFFSSHAWNYALQGIEHCLSWMGSHFPSPQGIIPLVGFSFMLSCYATSSLYPYPLQLVICESHLAEIGIGLTGFGVFFSFLGIIFFFDKGLLAMGNVSLLETFAEFFEDLSQWNVYACGTFQILFLSGLGLTIGLKSTLQFFTKPKNYKVCKFTVAYQSFCPWTICYLIN